MSRKKYRICPYCQTSYRSVCPICREERQYMQSTYSPDWAELEDMRLADEIMEENGELHHYDYDYGLEESFHSPSTTQHDYVTQ